MIAALIIVFREIVEAGLIIGIVLAVTRGVRSSRIWTLGGVAAGIVGSAALAAFTGALAATFAGSGQELFNATILAIAVLMLAWHNIWMARHGRKMSAELRATGEAVSAGTRSLAALAIVVGVAVLREGAEVVLFLYGIALSDNASQASLWLGGILGLLIGAAISALTYFGLVTIPARHIFSVTSTLIAFLAAGMAAQSVSFLEKAGVVTALDQTMWDTSGYLSEKSILGRVLHTLIGYSDSPSLMQVTVYIVVLLSILALTRAMSPRRQSGLRPA